MIVWWLVWSWDWPEVYLGYCPYVSQVSGLSQDCLRNGLFLGLSRDVLGVGPVLESTLGQFSFRCSELLDNATWRLPEITIV